MRNVVVGYDGSEQGKRALDRAAAFAGGGKVTVVTATGLHDRRPGHLGHGDAPGPEAILAAGLEHLASQGVAATGRAGEGEPADAILRAAKETGADLVVVGSRRLNVAERIVLGSVSTKVLHHAGCDVLVVS